MKVLMLDNYDSFTYNLVHYLAELGAETHVIRNDDLTVDQAWALKPEAVLLSPGPCAPDQAGICLPIVTLYTAWVYRVMRGKVTHASVGDTPNSY